MSFQKDLLSLTFQSYREMISRLKKKDYSFLFFEEADLLSDHRKSIVLLRHDLDFDPGPAISLAELEHQLGVRSTFFVLLTTQHYNFLTKRSRESISKLLKLGHHIGLHFDVLSHSISNEEKLNHCIRKEARLLESVAGVPIKVVSFHRPPQKWLNSFRRLTQPLIHTYEPKFFSEIAYYSDSTGRWSHGHPLESEAYRVGASMQVLIHPIWWHDRELTSYASLKQFLNRLNNQVEESMAVNCKAYRRGRFKNVCGPIL